MLPTSRRLPRSRWSALTGVLAVLMAMLPGLVISAAPASAASDPSQTSFTLSGCRNTGGITLPNGGGQFVCPDAAYTTGNLGKGWNELDLVPFRLTTGVGNQSGATTDYAVDIAVDNLNSGKVGYDLLSSPTVNLASHASCTVSSGPQSGDGTASLYRTLTIHQNKGTTCVFDFYARLAIGSHLYPGSSLHANLFNQNLGSSGIGSKDVSIPVKEILPQSISKTMSAVQGAAYDWTLNKTSTPVTRLLGDTCDATNTNTGTVQVTVSWSRLGPAPAGQILVSTSISATNPASRTITVNVSDDIRSGTTVLDTLASGAVDVPANTTTTVLSHSFTVASGTTDLNDVATATYTDKATQVAVPGTTTATASATVQSSGSTTNATATVSDTETLTGSGLAFRVDSTTGTSGTYTGGYTLGTYRTDPLTWTSGTLSGSGSATFNKTVSVTSATITSGSLSDSATLTGSEGLSRTAQASTAISSTALASATISKTMNQSFATSKAFSFELWSGVAPNGTDTGTSRTVTISSGTGPATATVTGLDPTLQYYFEEAATAPFPPQTTAGFGYALVAGDLSSCSTVVNVLNSALPATARVQKTTVPTGSTTWSFTLTGPNSLSETKTAVAGAGYVAFASTLDVDGGTYTITETQQPGWDNTGASGSIDGTNPRAATASSSAHTCYIVLSLTTDSGSTLSCSFENTQRGHVTLSKTVSGQSIPAGSPYSFPFSLSGGPDGISTTLNADGTNGGSLDFGLQKPGSYTMCEAATGVGWNATWQINGVTVAAYNPDAPSQDLGTRCVSVTLAAGANAAIAVDNLPPPGGGQRTIGYWKNWNSLARSAAFLTRQHPTHAIVDDFIGNGKVINLGNVHVDTVSKAVAILSNASMKYAEHGLGAQLLAAKLNVAAGAAPSCTSITAVITTADAELVSVGWSDANYATSKIVGSSYNGTYTRAQIAATQATLDAYNNGTCP